MSLTLYFHPLSSFCQKVVMALYENATPFTPHFLNLAEEKSRAEFLELWPIGKFPVLRDQARNQVVPESTIIIEYLERHYPGPLPLVPADADLAIEARLQDRFYDLHVSQMMQMIVGDRLRPADSKDPYGVAYARGKLQTAYGLIERTMASRTWAAGEAFTMADCAAAPALFYGDKVAPFRDTHPNTNAYFERLLRRPSFERALAEAKPYFNLFPQE
jgi:glutathione S-transferase